MECYGCDGKIPKAEENKVVVGSKNPVTVYMCHSCKANFHDFIYQAKIILNRHGVNV